MLNSAEHEIFLLINVEMPTTTVGISAFMSRKNSILGLFEPQKCLVSWYFYTYKYFIFHAKLSWAWEMFYYLGSSPNFR